MWWDVCWKLDDVVVRVTVEDKMSDNIFVEAKGVHETLK